MTTTFQEKKQTILIVVFIIVIMAIALVIYYGYYKPTVPPINLNGMNGSDIQDVIDKINFDTEFLKDPLFQALKIYGEWPIRDPENVGRDNPFSSFDILLDEPIEPEEDFIE